MRKSFIIRTAQEISRKEFVPKHARGCQQLRWLLFLLFPTWSIVSGQDVKSAWDLTSLRGEEAVRQARREQWFLRGRSSLGEPAARLRYRAHLQKLKMRAAQRKQQIANNPLSPPTAVWEPARPAAFGLRR